MKHIVFLGFLGLLIFACKNETKMNGSATNKAPVPAADGLPVQNMRKNIIFFGNSLTAAYGLSPEQGFTALIQKKTSSGSMIVGSIGCAAKIVSLLSSDWAARIVAA